MPNTFNISTDLIVSGSFSATSYSNVPFVTGGTYTSGTITFTNATGGTFNVTGLPVGGQGGQVYYFNTSVNQSPYKEFGPTGTTASEQSTTISVASGVTSTVQSYLTPSGYPNSLILPGGVWSFYLHSYKQDSSSSFDLYCDVYKRTSGGTETYLFSTDPFDVTSTASTPTMGITDGYYSGTPLTVSDRILVLVRATNTGVSTKQITFVTEGPTHYSYGITTFNGIPANVSSLTTGVGLSGNATTGAVTLVNTAPDLTVTISGGTNIQIAGSYPNFGVNFTGSTGSGTFTGGTVSGATNFTGGLTANTISATTATIRTIIGGSGNTNSGIYNFIGGGTGHSMSNISCYSSIVSGGKNTNCNRYSFIGGGSGNTVSGVYSFIGAGSNNNLSGSNAFVGGGNNNNATNCGAVVGGSCNSSILPYATVVGGCCNYSWAFNGFIGNGYKNTTCGTCSFIGGGSYNTNTSSQYYPNNSSVIVGGQYNQTGSGYYAPGSNFIGAGACNILNGSYSTISGGYKNNHNSGFYSFIGGGTSNTFSSLYETDNQASSIVGGVSNAIYRGQCSVIAGGTSNRICGGFAGSTYIGTSFIGAGGNNTITIGTLSAFAGSAIVGGNNNCVAGNADFIGGGGLNNITGTTIDYATLVGGCRNIVACQFSFIGGGVCNRITNQYSGILGGSGNTVSGKYSFAIGCGLTASANCTLYANNIITGTISATTYQGGLYGTVYTTGNNLNFI